MKKDEIIPVIKRNIIIRDNEKEICTLIDVANTGDRNAIKKETINVSKHKDFTITTQLMWV